jgi:hypothetical protein
MSDKEVADIMLTFATRALEAYAESLNLDLKKKEDRDIIQKDLVQAINAYIQTNK